MKKFKLFFRYVKQFMHKIKQDHVGEYAAQCAYFSFMSFIPFVILLLSLIKYMNIKTETLAYIIKAVFPTITQNSIFDILQEAYSKSKSVISISAVFMLWSAANSFYSLSLGLSAIYKVQEKHYNYILLRLKGIGGTLIILFSIIIVLIMIVFGNRINIILQEKISIYEKINDFIISIRNIIVFFSLFFAFMLIYKYVPGRRKNKFISQIPGALFVAIGWLGVSYFFSIYVDIFTEFSVIYGSLATLTLIMMWLYTIVYIILLGAEINVIMDLKLKEYFCDRS